MGSNTGLKRERWSQMRTRSKVLSAGLRRDPGQKHVDILHGTTDVTTHLVIDYVQLLSNMKYNCNGTMGLCHLPPRMKIQVEHGGNL